MLTCGAREERQPLASRKPAEYFWASGLIFLTLSLPFCEVGAGIYRVSGTVEICTCGKPLLPEVCEASFPGQVYLPRNQAPPGPRLHCCHAEFQQERLCPRGQRQGVPNSASVHGGRLAARPEHSRITAGACLFVEGEPAVISPLSPRFPR